MKEKKENSFLSNFVLSILYKIIYTIIHVLFSSPEYCLYEETEKQLMGKANDTLNLFYWNLALTVFILLLVVFLAYLYFKWRPWKRKTSLLIYISLALLVIGSLTSVYFNYNILMDYENIWWISQHNKPNPLVGDDFFEIREKIEKIEIIDDLLVIHVTYDIWYQRDENISWIYVLLAYSFIISILKLLWLWPIISFFTIEKIITDPDYYRILVIQFFTDKSTQVNLYIYWILLVIFSLFSVYLAYLLYILIVI